MDKDAAICLKAGERIDDLELDGLKIIQDPSLFCFGMDAVLLSSYAKVLPKDLVVDLCTGNGILPILLSAKTKAEHITGIELLKENVELARRSVGLNGLTDKIDIFQGDICDTDKILSLLQGRRVDVVTCNPPYMKGGLLNEKDAKTVARHEVALSLCDVVRLASLLLLPKGRVYFVHRPYRLSELMFLMHMEGVEPKRLKMVHPFAGKKPNLVLVEGIKGAKPFLSVEEPLVVYEEENVYTQEIMSMYGRIL